MEGWFFGCVGGCFLATQVDFFHTSFQNRSRGGGRFPGAIFVALLDNNIGNAM